MAGLQIQPRDLLKLGRLLLQNGHWNEQVIVRQDWLEQSLRVSTNLMKYHGWLWWLRPRFGAITVNDAHLAELERIGAPAADLERYAKLIGAHESNEAFSRAWDEHLDEHFYEYSGRAMLYDAEIRGFERFLAQGYLGQYLVVVPEHRLVAVRMLEWFDGVDSERHTFGEFASRVSELCSK
jgi:CubicO group peptidase (beta-lactamase class C family)